MDQVPADLARDRAGDEPGQYLDMWTAHRHRKALAPLEEADALFSAREAGATRARIRKATGLKPGDVTAALTAAKLSPDTRATIDALDHQLTLDQLSVLTEFDNDPQAIARLTTAAWTGAFEHEAERLRQQRAEHAEHERLRRDLDQAGVTVTETLPLAAHLLTGLRHDGADLTPESHAACPGRGAYFRSYDLTTPVHYCADPAGHGHTFRYADTRASGTTAGADGALSPDSPDGATDQPDPTLPGPGPADAARRVVISGNKAWRAALLTAPSKALAGGPLRRWLWCTNFDRLCSTAGVSSRGSGAFARAQRDRCHSSWSTRATSRSSRSRYFCGI